MRDFIDGTFAYAVALGATFSTFIWAYANEVTTVGGLLVLACRLYVDGGRAWRKWRGKDGE